LIAGIYLISVIGIRGLEQIDKMRELIDGLLDLWVTIPDYFDMD